MNKISVLRRFGVVAAIVAGGYSNGAFAAEVFKEDFANPIVFGDCNSPGALDRANPGPLWRQEVLAGQFGQVSQSVDVAAGNLALSSNGTVGGGIVSRLDPRFDFLSPGNKRKFIVKGVKIGGANVDQTAKQFRLLVSSHECQGERYANLGMTVYADGRFDVQFFYVTPNGKLAKRFLIDANYSLPTAAEQVELTLDNNNYELAFVYSVAEDLALPRSAYQGAFTYRGAHGITQAEWGKAQFPAEKYGASIGLFASVTAVYNPATTVTVDDITVTDGAP